MKEFFKNYSYYSVKMFLNQFAMAMLGMTVALAFGISGNNTGKLVSSICTVLFYLFLIYYMTWEVGSRDRVIVNSGKLKNMPLKGLYMSLLANSLNFIIAILFTAFVNLRALMIVLANVIEGMYAGILATPYKTIIENGEAVGVMLNKAWWAYFVIIIPALLISTISYYFGTKNIHFTPLLNPVNPEKEEIKRMNKMNKKR